LILFSTVDPSAQAISRASGSARSDNGEFSVEFPAGYDFYADKRRLFRFERFPIIF